MTTEKFACPCCGYKTLEEKPGGTFGICQVCFWEDDFAELGPDYEGGVNGVSLRQAQKNFVEFGACEKSMLELVRQPAKDEIPDEDWKPLS